MDAECKAERADGGAAIALSESFPRRVWGRWGWSSGVWGWLRARLPLPLDIQCTANVGTVSPALNQLRTPALPLQIVCHLLGSGNQSHGPWLALKTRKMAPPQSLSNGKVFCAATPRWYNVLRPKVTTLLHLSDIAGFGSYGHRAPCVSRVPLSSNTQPATGNKNSSKSVPRYARQQRLQTRHRQDITCAPAPISGGAALSSTWPCLPPLLRKCTPHRWV